MLPPLPSRLPCGDAQDFTSALAPQIETASVDQMLRLDPATFFTTLRPLAIAVFALFGVMCAVMGVLSGADARHRRAVVDALTTKASPLLGFTESVRGKASAAAAAGGSASGRGGGAASPPTGNGSTDDGHPDDEGEPVWTWRLEPQAALVLEVGPVDGGACALAAVLGIPPCRLHAAIPEEFLPAPSPAAAASASSAPPASSPAAAAASAAMALSLGRRDGLSVLAVKRALPLARALVQDLYVTPEDQQRLANKQRVFGQGAGAGDSMLVASDIRLLSEALLPSGDAAQTAAAQDPAVVAFVAAIQEEQAAQAERAKEEAMAFNVASVFGSTAGMRTGRRIGAASFRGGGPARQTSMALNGSLSYARQGTVMRDRRREGAGVDLFPRFLGCGRGSPPQLENVA